VHKGLLAAATVAALAVSTPALAQRCEHSRDIDLSTSASGADLVSIIANAGDLVVEGGGTEIVITGRACASSESRLEELDVKLDTRGGRVEIETEMPESSWSWFGSNYAYIDLEVRVPTDLAVRIDDGSGDLTVSGIASADIEDGSGDVDVRDVSGEVSVNDGSGDIYITGAGSVWVDDGSGDIDVRDAREVMIDDDGSGDIDIQDVTGSVTVGDDGSGSIRVADVGGDFTVHSDGSGGIRHSNVGGTVDIPRQR
jgi:DUF4097 and DUF4098 domain-containing protein YvlB